MVRRALLAAARFHERAQRACLHIAAGLTPLAQMREGINERWNDYALDDDAIDAGLLPWEQEFGDRFLTPGARVLVVGCGSGRDVVALARRGFDVVGVDPAGDAIQVARAALAKRGLQADLIEGFFEDRQWPATFDVVSFSYYTYCYIPGSARRIEALRLARRALRPGGLVLLNFFPSPGPERLSFLGTWAAKLSGNDWIPDRGDAIAIRPVNECLTYEHYFQQDQLNEELTRSGLELVTLVRRGHAVVARNTESRI